MKKIIITLFASLFFVSLASAELGVNIGVSGTAAVVQATGQEAEGSDIDKESVVATAGWASIFIEKSFGDRFAIGVDYVPDALPTETSDTVVSDKTTSETSTKKTNTVKLEFSDLTTYYATLRLTQGLYAKVGMMSMDIETKENLATGSEYGNTDTDGTLVGLGYNHTADNGFFVRVEGNYMQFEAASLTSTTNADNTAKISDLNGLSGKISIGKSF